MPTLEHDDININYEAWGDPESPLVVLLHGFTADLRMWRSQVEPLARDYRVVAPDLRGHGLTTAPDDPAAYSIDRYAADVAALLDHLGAEVAAVVGCSFGGMVALQFATTWPQRLAGLVVSDASPAPASERYDDAFREREADIAGDVDIARRFGTVELGKRRAREVADEFLAEGIRQRYAAMATEGFVGAAGARTSRPDLIPLLGQRLTMPVLLCWGDRDPTASAGEVMAAELPGARVAVFREAGHGVPVLRAEPFRQAVLAFLRDIEEGRPVAGRRYISATEPRPARTRP